MKCNICNNETENAFSHPVREKFHAEYRICKNCDYMFVENPSWLAEAYARPINITDTGYVMRNIYLSRKTLLIFTYIFGLRGATKKTFLDYAAGYGMLTRILRDYGLNFLWDDPYTENFFANGFEYKKGDTIDALTCFECFEHFVEPLPEIEKMLGISDTIFFSTQLKPVGVIPQETWGYYGFNHGQHTSFYSKKTFEAIAKKYSLTYVTDGNTLHLLTKKKVSKRAITLVNFLSKIQLDLPLRKLLKSKTTADHDALVAKGF